MKKYFAALLLCAASALLPAETRGAKSLRDFGVLPENSPRQNAKNFQAAIDEMSKIGGAIFVEPAAGGYPMASGIILRKNVSLIGAHGPVSRGTSAASGAPTGSLFIITDADKPFITVQSATTIRGIQFYYPRQTVDNPAKIIEYPPTIKRDPTASVYGITLSCLTFYGEFCAMDFTTDKSSPQTLCELVLIEHCYGYPLSGEFIKIDRCYDVPRILHCHVNPANMRLFKGVFSKAVKDSVVARKTFAYSIETTDNAQIIDIFTFGTYGGIKLGAKTYGQLTNFNFDCVCVGILKDGNQDFNRNWQIAQGSIIANVGGKIEDVHPIIIRGFGHTSLANVEAFSGHNKVITTLGESFDYLYVAPGGAPTIFLSGCRMRNYKADNPITNKNPKAKIRASGCIDKHLNFFEL